MTHSTPTQDARPIRIVQPQRVNGKRPTAAFGAALLEQALVEAQSIQPEDVAASLQQITDRRELRWSLRRIKERLTYDIALRLFVFAIWAALMTVPLLWIVVGE